MKIIGLIAIFSLLNIQCINFDRTNLHHGVSIWLPEEFIQLDISDDYKKTSYESSSNGDKLEITSHFFNAIGSATTERKMDIVESNLENIAKSENGRNITKQNLQTIESVIQNEYSMLVGNNDSTNVLFAKVVNRGPNVLLLKYYTPQPAKKKSIKTKDKIFNSIEFE